jgi:hypothetical protein
MQKLNGLQSCGTQNTSSKLIALKKVSCLVQAVKHKYFFLLAFLGLFIFIFSLLAGKSEAI